MISPILLRPLDGRSRGWWTLRIATYDLAGGRDIADDVIAGDGF